MQTNPSLVSTVSCAGVDEANDPAGLALLASRHPLMEIAVQVSQSRQGSAQYPGLDWIGQLVHQAELVASAARPPRLALHLNGIWCRQACRNQPDQAILDLLDLRVAGQPAFSRVQLNFEAARGDVAADVHMRTWLARLVEAGIRPILQSNPGNTRLIPALSSSDFDLLFDASCGWGVRPAVWPDAPPPGRYVAWAGGLGPDTVSRDVAELAGVARRAGHASFGLDAQRLLRTPGTLELFEPARAESFVVAAGEWNRRNMGV